jgi:hypothetical protein
VDARALVREPGKQARHGHVDKQNQTGECNDRTRGDERKLTENRDNKDGVHRLRISDCEQGRGGIYS